MGDSSSISKVEYSQFGRVGKIELLQDGSPISGFNLDGLDFKFKTNMIYMGKPDGVAPSAHVSILGLSKRSVDNLCTFCDIATYQQRGISVRVSAGYEYGTINGLQELFTLPVVRAIPAMPPDNWVTLTCQMFAGPEHMKDLQSQASLEEMKKTGYKPKNVKESMEEIGKAIGIAWSWKQGSTALAEKYSIEPYSFCGGTEDALNMFRRKCPYLDIRANPALNKFTRKQYLFDVYPKGAEVKANNTWIINKNTGMIGLPSWIDGSESRRRVQIRTLLNPSYRPFDKIVLDSEIATGLSGSNYYIQNVSHTGHLRGNEWYSDIQVFDGKIEGMT